MLEHEVVFSPGFDCIRFECRHGSENCRPGFGGSHGRGGVALTFYAKGEKGAIQFAVLTGWEVEPGRRCDRPTSDYPLPSDLGYHSPVQFYPEQEPMTDDCPVLGGKCYYDGSTLNAEEPFRVLCNEGHEALWTYLDAVYERAKSLGCLSKEEVHSEPGGKISVRPWGERSFYAEDQWKNPLCFVEEGTVYEG